MPRFSYDDQLTTDQPTQSCATALRAAIQALGATLDAAGGTDMEAEKGTQAFRIIGGILSSADMLPVQIHGHVEDMGAQRVIYLQVAENMGMGLMHGMENKYRQHCQDLLAQLKGQLAAQLGTTASA